MLFGPVTGAMLVSIHTNISTDFRREYRKFIEPFCQFRSLHFRGCNFFLQLGLYINNTLFISTFHVCI